MTSEVVGNRSRCLKGDISHKEFWVVDLRTGRERQLTNLDREFFVGDFDVSANGPEIVFDRAREEVGYRPVRPAGSMKRDRQSPDS